MDHTEGSATGSNYFRGALLQHPDMDDIDVKTTGFPPAKELQVLRGRRDMHQLKQATAHMMRT